jgi:hypothetical protein
VLDQQTGEQMKRDTFALCLLGVILILIAVDTTTLYQRNTAIRRYQAAETTVEQFEACYDRLATYSEVQEETIGVWLKENRGLARDIDKQNEAIRGYKARAEALEGRLHKISGAYRFRELELLEEIKRLKEYIQSISPPQDKILHDTNNVENK